MTELVGSTLEFAELIKLLRETLREPLPEVEKPTRHKASHVGAPAVFSLHQCGQILNDAFGDFGPYLVGSSLERPDWRDIDVRYILRDSEFTKLFPDAQMHGAWEFDPRWMLMSISISAWMRTATGLPVDFQFQPQTWANTHHKKHRSPIGLRYARGQSDD